MKTKRTFASLCLALSCCALITASNVSVGDQPGVVSLTSGQQTFAPPVPPVVGEAGAAPQSRTFESGSGTMHGPMEHSAPPVYSSQAEGMFQPSPMMGGVPMGASGMPMGPQGDYTPYFESSGVTEAPVLGRRPEENPLFGPQLMFETNIDNGLGFNEAYHRANVRLPYHVVPGNSVLMGDMSASLTNDGTELYNFGLIWRNYDAMRNRVFGWNAYYDVDDGRGNSRWKRVGVGVESLGKYIDFRANGYHVVGDDSHLLNDSLVGDLALGGNNVFRIRNQTRDNAYSGADVEVGGPVPLFGRRGISAFAGAYYLDNDMGYETVGFSARWEALVTESATVNVHYTKDDTFGTNSWVSIAYTIPNYRERAIFQPRNVRDRLADPVVRSNRVHSNIDIIDVPEAVVNEKTGSAYNLVYVDPNRTLDGTGTFEDPYGNLQLAATNNNAGIDMIRVAPREDDTNTNLTVNGGIDLFECQALVSTVKDYTLFIEDTMPFIIPGVATETNFGPLISNPNMGLGGSVVRVTNGNTVLGMRIDGANADGTIFGTGIANNLPFEDINIVCNTFTNYATAVDLQNASGNVVLDENTASGLAGASESGLVLTTATGVLTNLLVRNNTVSNNSVSGIRVTTGPNSTLNADNPNAVSAIPGVAAQATGIIGNTVTDGGQGIEVIAQPGSTANVVADSNVSTGNTFNGFVGRADDSEFNLAMRDNTFNSNLENGALLHYLNGGMFSAISEDVNGDGILDPAEDTNGNGVLDGGITANIFNNNSVAGLCLFGEDDATGVFDIGGPVASLGNTFLGNTGAGVAVDLRDTSTAQIDALFNTVQGGSSVPGLTIVLDFIDPGQAPVTDIFGVQINPFDVTNYGFAPADFDAVTNAVLATVQGHYGNIPNVTQDSRSPIPDGMELNIDFVIGENGAAPSNGATEFYVVNIGDSNGAAGGGIANNIGNVRDATGVGPNPDLFGNPTVNGDDVAQVYADSLTTFGPLTPANAFDPDILPQPLGDAPAYAATALTSGNLTFTRRALGLVTSHEIGHTLSLRHVDDAGAITPNGNTPLMGTPAFPFLLPIQTLIEPAEFAFEATHLSEGAGDPQFQQFNIAQLASAVGLRVASGETKNGFAVNSTGDSRLIASTFNNNTITGASEHGINIEMSDNARAEGLTIQGNTISNGGGHGIRLAADGNAFIDADNTIGGAGTNTYRGVAFSQSNTISNNAGDGFRALASNGGTIHGNLINNSITDNGGNGAALLIENGGFIDFGTPASNRIISGNTITGNTGAGIRLVSNVSATSEAQMDVVVQGNTVTGNAGGGLVSNQNGPNHTPPAVPAVVNNNRMNLTVGGATATQANDLSGNADAGIAAEVTGNAKLIFDLRNSTVSGTTDGADPLLNGDGINLRRADSSLLLATIDNVTSTNNAGDGLDVDVQGNDKNDLNQPMTGTVNTVDWTNSLFSNNGENGARFRVRGDAQLIADGTNNVLNNNGTNGILVQTSESASFGDPTVGLPPGRRVVFDGIIANENGQDGLNILATEQSRALVEVTSNRIAGSTDAHAALNTNGDSSFSSNGRDGVRITTTGGQSDVLITSGTGATTIANNGTVAGGNGIRWNASGNSDGSVRVTRTTISGNIAGGTEDTALNGNGVLDPGEDVNGNGVLDPGEDTNNNDNIDVDDGDGIQYNVFGNATATLVVGGNLVGDGNLIQNNQDDGVAITATGSGLNISRPVISVTGNTIGGESSGIQAGNAGDGLSMNILGGTFDLNGSFLDPANLDTDIGDGNGLTFSDGLQESGPLVQFSGTGNLISNNGQRGANFLLNGAAGERDREDGNNDFDPVRITLTGNTIVSNGTEGVFFRADSDINQGRLTYLANFPFVGPPANERPRTPAFYAPSQAEFLSDNLGSVNGNTAFSSAAPDGAAGYLNLRTVQNSFLTVVGNSIQNNGIGTVTGEGLVLSIGTGAYAAADVRNNVFGGNLEEDVRTESFLSLGNTFASVDDAGATNFDAIYHDDSAQLDMRFLGNEGNQISISSDGAAYNNTDTLKSIVLGPIGVLDRDAAFFQIDDGGNLDNPNNTFINFGITQDIDGAFATGGFNLRGAADPGFPNIGFAPFLP